MSVHHSNANPEQDTQPAPAAELRQPRTRRALLAGLLGGAGALVAGAVGRVNPIRAVVANPVLMGVNNDAGTGNTSLTTQSTGTALLVTQNGSGTALRGSAVGAGSIAGFFTAQNGTGISGVTGNPGSYGVFGQNNGAAGSAGAMRADGKNNHGLVATSASSKNAVYASNSGGTAAYTTTASPSANGVYAENTDTSTGNAQVAARAVANGEGVFILFFVIPSAGVWATNNNTTGSYTAGVWAESYAPSGFGVRAVNYASSGNAYGIYASTASSSGIAGYFYGNLTTTGTLSKAGGSFKIDHPLDPANKYLLHSFVESPDMMNVYNGNVTTDARGQATIELPDWFEAVNRDFRYQLTVIGAKAQAWVASEVKNNRFTVETDAPRTRVSWQVTGIRQDAWANAHRIPTEVAKSGDEKGKYLHPVEHGQPASAGIEYESSGQAAIDKYGAEGLQAARREEMAKRAG
jgi:hypothetical protein